MACSPAAEAQRINPRWTQRELADHAAEVGLVPSIHQTTVGAILKAVDLKPHRTRYWLTSQDPDFRAKATSVLWYYERAWDLARKGILVICVDEKPNLQALSRPNPDRLPAPGFVRRRDFNYRRNGTVSLLLGLDVTSGNLWGTELKQTNSAEFIAALERLLTDFHDFQRIELVLDNGPAHTSKLTRAWFRQHHAIIRPHYTPFHASWLNQAELALAAFATRFLRGASFASRSELREHIEASIHEYNSRYACPFDWSFSRHDMRNLCDRRNRPLPN